MENWEHLVVEVNREHGQLVVTPSQPDLEFDAGDLNARNRVKVLDGLGQRGWQLVAVNGDEFWLKKPVEPVREELDPLQSVH